MESFHMEFTLLWEPQETRVLADAMSFEHNAKEHMFSDYCAI
jgi:hypothetical protein